MDKNDDLVLNQAAVIVRRFGTRANASRLTGISPGGWQGMENAGFVHPRHYPVIVTGAILGGVLMLPSDFDLVNADHEAFARLLSGATNG